MNLTLVVDPYAPPLARIAVEESQPLGCDCESLATQVCSYGGEKCLLANAHADAQLAKSLVHQMRSGWRTLARSFAPPALPYLVGG